MKLSPKVNSIILSLCEVIIGVLLLVNPVRFTTGIIIFLGIVFLLIGISNVVKYFRTPPQIAALKNELARGSLEILAGIFCIAKSRWFWTAISAVLTVACAVIILCNPFSSTTVLWTFIAIILIVQAVLDIFAAIFTVNQEEVI